MRENVKKLIDLMKKENWSYASLGRHGGAFHNNKEYPMIDSLGTRIIFQCENLELQSDETAYFILVRSIIYKKYQEEKDIRVLDKLNEFLKTK